VDRPEEVVDIHKAYLQAGADVIITNTFGANRWKLDAYGLSDRVAAYNAAGAKAAREAAGAGKFAAGDIGPTGRFVAPLGSDAREAFVEVFAEQAAALAAAGVDALILETFTALDELLAGVEGAKRTGLPVIACMSFTRTADGSFRTMMGDEAASSAVALEDAGVDIVGANCGAGADDYVDLASRLTKSAKRPTLVEPNAGMPQLIKGKTVFPMSAEEFASFVPKYIGAGVRIVGGCCGTTPEHIRLVREVVDRAV
jgi:5-methyltetrahydrofolate--homocysteine methyltransferase